MRKALIITTLFVSACQANKPGADVLYRVTDTLTGKEGYINTKGDTVIAMGKYPMCFTDIFKTFAIVADKKEGFIGIDRKEQVLFKVYPFDNGPDYPAEGYVRIIDKDNKLGYADTTGKVMITPRYGCALPFEKGRAQVGDSCTTELYGEHSVWKSDKWYYIDKTGKRVK